MPDQSGTAFGKNGFYNNIYLAVTSQQPYFTLNYSQVSRSQLAHYLHRAGWLNVGRDGTLSEEMLTIVETEPNSLVFLRLNDPDDDVPDHALAILRKHRPTIITSPYPQRLFEHLELRPLKFLPEPYSFGSFVRTLNMYRNELV